MLPVPPGILYDPPTALETLIRAYRALSRQIYDASSTRCALKPSDVRRGAARALRPVADGSWVVQVQGRSSNRRLPTELQTYKVTEYGVRIYVLGRVPVGRVPVGRIPREMTLGADLYRVATYNTNRA